MLPPRPSARVALWAAANACWFRLAAAFSRILQSVAGRLLRALAARERPALPACEARSSLAVERLVMIARGSALRRRASAAERVTVPQVRRAH